MAEEKDTFFINIISKILRVFLLAGFVAVIVHMCLGIYMVINNDSLNLNLAVVENSLYSLVDIIVEDSLLAIVVFEIYKSIVEFFHGHSDTISYVINAGISFTAREIILTVFIAHIFKIVDLYEILAFSILIVALSIARYIIGISRNTE
ncbi:MAG: phosphate-starvation-inducible PsiE family protein [Ferroplasma sp.]